MSMNNCLIKVEIKSNPSKIWDVLTDINAYHEWNPFVKNIKGSLVLGDKIEILLSDDDNNETTKCLKVKKIVKDDEIILSNKEIIPGIFSQEYLFKIEKITSKKCLVKQKIKSEGLFKLMLLTRQSNTSKMLKIMLDALKKRVEN